MDESRRKPKEKKKTLFHRQASYRNGDDAMSVGKLDGVGGRVEQLTVTVVKDEKGYGMTVSGNDPVVVQAVVVNGAAWRAGVRYADRLVRVNGTAVEKSMHNEVVNMIKSSTTATLVLQRPVSVSKVTAPLPVDRDKQRQVENMKIRTLKMMLEEENRHKERLKSSLAHSPCDKTSQELDAAELRIAKLIQSIENFSSPFITKDLPEFRDEPPATPPRQQSAAPNNIPRSLSCLTGQSLRVNRTSIDSSPPVTCLDSTPPPLPPRTPITLSPGAFPSGGISPRAHQKNSYPTIPPPTSTRHMEPNSIGVQMNYPLSAMHPPAQTGVGHQRSRSSPEQLGQMNHSDSKEWEMVVTPPGTPPPPYLTQPVCQIPIDPQKNIISMEEDDSPATMIHRYSFGGFANINSLSPARKAVFLNWLAGEKRPPQAALLHFLSAAYSSGPATSLQRWAYELHSVFLVPGAPLALSNVDENLAKEIDDILINDSDKEYILRNIFSKVRRRAEEELNQQLSDFQIKRQTGLGSFYGPNDAELDACENDSTQKNQVIKNWLMPRLDIWLQESQGDSWGVTQGSSQASILAATIHPLLQYTFGLKTDVVNNLLGVPATGCAPRPSFLQRDKSYKQRIKYLNKATSHPLIIRGHHLSPITVTTICHCHHCHLLVWGIAPQAYNCSDCKLRVHRSCAKRIEETCCVQPSATRMSRIMERLAPGPTLIPTGNSHQHIELNQHLHHDKKQRKSLATSHFLNMERRKTDEDNAFGENNPSFSGTPTGDQGQAEGRNPLKRLSTFYLDLDDDIELEINPPGEENTPEEEKARLEDIIEKRDEFMEMVSDITPIVLTDSECEVDKKKKIKPKHRKTMSMSNTIEMVKHVGDEWFEHSKKKENSKKKKESLCADPIIAIEKSENVVLLLSDATVGETDDFEVVVGVPPGKTGKKKEPKIKDATPKIATSQIMIASQKMGAKMMANFIKKKRPAPIVDAENSFDHIILSTELFLGSEREHSDMVRPADGLKSYLNGNFRQSKNDDGNKTASEDEYYDAKEDSHGSDEEHVLSTDASTCESKPKPSKSDPKVIGSRTRKNFGGSLKRTVGARRKGRRKSSADEPPPLPPKAPPPPPAPKQSHWLFGSSFKGDGKNIVDEAGDGTHLTESWDKSFDHSTDRADSSHALRQRPVTRAESYRDKAAKVQRTKRKTSDPNQLTSGNAFNDAEASGNAGAPSGASSSSSLSSRSNESAGQPERHDSHSEWSDEEDNTEPWSTQARAEVLATMSMQARKRQDLIHELITTEVSHVRWLRILQRVFFSPLQHSKLLSVSELRDLFPNLPDVLQRHRRLSADLKTLAASASVVKTKPLAEALINTLGDPKYPVALAKFCAGQRLALDALREKQRRNKELYAYMVKREQEPLCARRRLQDFLACVWQRLTKYQLLLEGIIKTGREDENEPDEDDGFSKISHALELSKEILHTVDTAIKTRENEHKLKHIQSKLEVRGVGGTGGFESDPGELRKLDLAKHSLIIEGSLSIRQDSTKRLTVNALMLNESLVLLQKESDRYILRPIPQGTMHTPLSPVIQLKTVLFRTNASEKYGFFLVNVNGVQMYDISANNATDYNMWMRHLSEAAKALGPRSGPVEEGPPPPLPPNPPPVTATTQEEASNDTSDPNINAEEDDAQQPPNPDDENETSGATSTVEGENRVKTNSVKLPNDELMAPSSVDIISPPPALTAYRQLTPEERLRQAEEKVILALQEAAEAAKEVVNAPPSVYSAMETLLGKSFGNNADDRFLKVTPEETPTKHLLLTAQSHVDTLTEVLFRALRVSPSNCSMTKCSVHSTYGLCDTCFAKHSKYLASSKRQSTIQDDSKNDFEASAEINDSTEVDSSIKIVDHSQVTESADNKLDSFVVLESVGESSTDPGDETDLQLIATSSIGLREILATLVQRLPAEDQEREILRARLQQADQRLHRLHHLHRDCAHSDDGANDKPEIPNPISDEQNNGG